jgi:hypothetical protein
MYLLSAACGTYCIILECDYYIRTKRLLFLRLFSQLLCVIVKEKLYSAANL